MIEFMKKEFVLNLSRKEFLYLLSLVKSVDAFYNSDLFYHYLGCSGSDDVLVLNSSINDKLVSCL